MSGFKTSDIILAAYLRLQGNQLQTIELEGNRGIFCFVDPIDQEVMIDYNLGNLRVEPVSFNNTIKQLTTAVRRMLV